MRAYLIDEISKPDMEKITKFLKKHATHSSLDQIYWIKIPEDILSDVQFRHKDCQPHVFAIELGSDWIKLELFIRTLMSIRCDCPAYCTSQQKNYLFKFADGMIEQLGINT